MRANTAPKWSPINFGVLCTPHNMVLDIAVGDRELRPLASVPVSWPALEIDPGNAVMVHTSARLMDIAERLAREQPELLPRVRDTQKALWKELNKRAPDEGRLGELGAAADAAKREIGEQLTGRLYGAHSRELAEYERSFPSVDYDYVENSGQPPPPPPRPGHPDTQRRMVRLVEEEERPFEPEREYERETRGHHFAVNTTKSLEQIQEWLQLPGTESEEVKLLIDAPVSGPLGRIEASLMEISNLLWGPGVARLVDANGDVQALAAVSAGETPGEQPTVVANLQDRRWELVTLNAFVEWFAEEYGTDLQVH